MPGGPPRTLLMLFLAVTLGPACGLIFLGWQLVRQDGALAAQRLTEVREQTADVSVAALVGKLAAVERQLAEGRLTAEPGAILATIAAGRITNIAGGALLFEERPATLPEAPRETFAAGETAEFRSALAADAAVQYGALTKHGRPAVRAGAWMRIARVERKANRVDAALAAYREAAAIGGVAFAGVPVELAARRAACALFAASGRREELRPAAADLAADLFAGKWRLTRAQYEAHAAEISEWCACPRPAAHEALTAAALSLAANAADRRAAGREIAGPVTILWQRQRDHLRPLVAGQDYVERRWIRPVAQEPRARLWMGEDAEKQHAIHRGTSATGLPWPIAVALASPETVLASLATRRELLLAALALIIVLAVAGSYVVARAVGRELAVAPVDVGQSRRTSERSVSDAKPTRSPA